MVLECWVDAAVGCGSAAVNVQRIKMKAAGRQAATWRDGAGWQVLGRW